MKKILQTRFSKIVTIHLLSLGTVLMLWLASPAFESGSGFTMRNPANWVIVLFLSICTVWQYVFLKLSKVIRQSVWIFPALGMFLCIVGWILSFTAQAESSGGWIAGSFGDNDAGGLLFAYGFLCPILLSSCSASWGAAPSTIGKATFTVAIVLLAAIGIHLSVLTENMRYILVVALLAMIALVLYLWPTSSQTADSIGSEVNDNETNH